MTATAEKALYGPINPASRRRCPFYSEKPDSRARLACRVTSYRSLTRHNVNSPHQTGDAAPPLSTLPSAFIHMKASQQKVEGGGRCIGVCSTHSRHCTYTWLIRREVLHSLPHPTPPFSLFLAFSAS